MNLRDRHLKGQLFKRAASRGMTDGQFLRYVQQNWRRLAVRRVERLLGGDDLFGLSLESWHEGDARVGRHVVQRIDVSEAASGRDVTTRYLNAQGIESELVSRPRFHERVLYELRDVLVDTATGVPWNDKGYLLSCASAYGVDFRATDVSRTYRKKPTAHYEGRWLLLPHVPNYFHFMIELLPGLLEAQRRLDISDLLVDTATPGWIVRELTDLKFNIRRSHQGPARIDQYCVPTRQPMLPTPHEVAVLREAFLGSLKPAPRAKGDLVIYLSRKSHGRVPVWESEFEARLSRRGALVISPEMMTAHQQAQTMSSAGTIIGRAGAALTNIVWAPPGCKLGVLNMEVGHHGDIYSLLASSVAAQALAVEKGYMEDVDSAEAAVEWMLSSTG
jgi:hypothetical protein